MSFTLENLHLTHEAKVGLVREANVVPSPLMTASNLRLPGDGTFLTTSFVTFIGDTLHHPSKYSDQQLISCLVGKPCDHQTFSKTQPSFSKDFSGVNTLIGKA